MYGCKIRSKLPVIQIQVNASFQQPVQMSVCDFFSNRFTPYFIDTANVTKVFHFIPGQMFSLYKDTNWLIFNSDTILIDKENINTAIKTYNQKNKQYNLFINDCYELRAPYYQEFVIYFLQNQDSIIANENFIEHYLSNYDSLFSKKVHQIFLQYTFPEDVKDDLLHYVLETKKLSDDYYFLTESIPVLDSLGLLNKRLQYYINQINQQKISVFSQGDIALLISNIAKLMTKTSISRLKTGYSISQYFSDLQHYFNKGSICYDYLVAALFVHLKRKNIKLNGHLYRILKNETKKSIFLKYIDKNILNQIDELEDSPKNKNLYDIQSHSQNLSDILTQYNKKPLLVYFWATWCLPCLKSLPEISNLHQLYPDLNIVYISVDQSQDGWKSYLFEHNMYASNQFRRNYVNQDSIFKNIFFIPKYGLLNENGNLSLFDEINDSIMHQYLMKFKFRL